MRIIHRVEKGKVTERLVSLDGSGREIIRNQTEVICYLPDRRTVLVEKRTDDRTLLATVPIYNEQLEAHYNIERGAVHEGARPPHASHPGAAARPVPLWLPAVARRRDGDAAEVAAVRSQRQRHRADRVRRTEFPRSHSRRRGEAHRSPARASAGCGRTRRSRAWRTSPLGWNVIRLPVRVPADDVAPADHRRLERAGAAPGASDGLASVSVFIEPRSPQTEAMRGLAKVGAAFAYSRDLDGHQVTAVGEVPAATVEAIAEAVTKEEAALAPVAREQRQYASATVSPDAPVDGLQPGRLQPVRAHARRAGGAARSASRRGGGGRRHRRPAGAGTQVRHAHSSADWRTASSSAPTGWTRSAREPACRSGFSPTGPQPRRAKARPTGRLPAIIRRRPPAPRPP